MTNDDIRARVDAIRERIAKAAARAGRDANEVTILGACKQVDQQRIFQAIELGIDHVGENQVQEAEAKFKEDERHSKLKGLHLIGHLQSNKVKRAVELFDVVQSVDSLRLAERMNGAAKNLNKRLPIYIEVNIGSETTKEGVSREKLTELAAFIAGCENLALAGLMTVPPHLGSPNAARPYFSLLRELRDGLVQQEPYRNTNLGLSMGMTDDFEVAVEEGATMVRLGSAIWGSRPA